MALAKIMSSLWLHGCVSKSTMLPSSAQVSAELDGILISQAAHAATQNGIEMCFLKIALLLWSSKQLLKFEKVEDDLNER